jgi:hypothetical protein
MRDNLDTIAWSEIYHAYGPASDVPAILRTLASGGKEQRERALSELHGNIWHQGTVYEATAFAVPFLLELVRDRHPNSLEILCLLALIADGSSYMAVHTKLLIASSPDDERQLNREIVWVKQAKNSVAKGQEIFLQLLGAKDRRLREIGILLLGLICPVAPENISAGNVIEAMFEMEN